MRRTGSTLIEIAIAVAVIGILVPIVGSVGVAQARSAQLELERERAWQLLEACADAAMNGATVEARVLTRLKEGLPEAALSVRRERGIAWCAVEWGARGASRQSVALAVFVKETR